MGPYICKPGDSDIHVGPSQLGCAQPTIIGHGEDGHEDLDPQVRPVQQRKADALDCEVELAHAAVVEVTEVGEKGQWLLAQNLGVDSTQLHTRKLVSRLILLLLTIWHIIEAALTRHTNTYSSQNSGGNGQELTASAPA